MAEKTIPQLPSASSIDENTLFPVDSGTQTFKATAETIADYINGLSKAASDSITKKMIATNWFNVGPTENIGTDYPTDVREMAYSPSLGVLVCVSSSLDSSNRGIFYSSDNMKTWTAASSPTNEYFYTVTWIEDFGLFIAGGSDGALYTSPDGATWTSRTSGTTNHIRDFAYSPNLGRVVAISPTDGADAVIMSSNGTSWSLQTTPAASDGSFLCVSRSDELGIFTAVGRGEILHSADGLTWTLVLNAFNKIVDHTIWSPELELFIAVGVDEWIATSTDGINFTERRSNSTDQIGLESVAWSPELELLIAVPGSVYVADKFGSVFISEDGITWEKIRGGLGNDTDSNLYGSILWVPELNRFLIGGDGSSEFMVGASLKLPSL